MREVAIFLCDITGHMADPWVNGGYDVILVDPQHKPGVCVSGPRTTVGHVIDHPGTWGLLRKVAHKRRIAFVAGFPPCTDLAVSGARWFEEKSRKDWAFQFRAMHVVWQCQVIGEMSGAPWMIENPNSVISSLWRKPDHTFHPCDYTAYEANDNYKKKTMLWTGGGFCMPPPVIDYKLGMPDDRIHRAPPSEDRANFRSATPKGFAQAVYYYNNDL